MIALDTGDPVLERLVAGLATQAPCAMPAAGPDLRGHAAEDVFAARLAWASRIVDEHRSVAVFAELLRLLARLEAPYGALVAVQRLLGDELRHVRLCAEVAGWLGGLDDLEVDLSDVGPPPGGEPPAARALLLVARELVVAEAESLAALRAFRDAATEPAIRSALQLLVADEALHVVVGRRLLPLLARTLPRSQTGPTLARLDDLMEADRRELRAAYLAAAGGGPGRALGASLEPRDLRWTPSRRRARVA